MIGRKVFCPKFKEGDTVELIYFYLITSKGNERLTFNNCLRLINTKKVRVSDIGIMKRWVIVQEVIHYGLDKFGYIASANLHTNKLILLVAHNQYPNFDYQIKNMNNWRVIELNLCKGCRPTEYIYETLEIVKNAALYERKIPKSFLKKILA